jgi:hypothetical protein
MNAFDALHQVELEVFLCYNRIFKPAAVCSVQPGPRRGVQGLWITLWIVGHSHWRPQQGWLSPSSPHAAADPGSVHASVSGGGGSGDGVGGGGDGAWGAAGGGGVVVGGATCAGCGGRGGDAHCTAGCGRRGARAGRGGCSRGGGRGGSSPNVVTSRRRHSRQRAFQRELQRRQCGGVGGVTVGTALGWLLETGAAGGEDTCTGCGLWSGNSHCAAGGGGRGARAGRGAAVGAETRVGRRLTSSPHAVATACCVHASVGGCCGNGCGGWTGVERALLVLLESVEP